MRLGRVGAGHLEEDIPTPIDAAFAEIKAINKERRKVPSVDPMDPNFKRLRYCRYADDFPSMFLRE